jgi:6-pyruvoyltetrahydropterin/6-carboxytetrahydropterin synthase
MNNVGMESTAELVWGWANDLLFSREKGRSCCWKAIAHENDVNSASYTFLPEWFNP